jgi:4-hydroxy-3-polyprenylbenzoate decarboxylase
MMYGGRFDLPPYIIILGDDANLDDADASLFRWLAHSDAGRDARLIGDTLFIDATPKMPGDEHAGLPVRDWPPILTSNLAIRAKVSARWAEYGLGT